MRVIYGGQRASAISELPHLSSTVHVSGDSTCRYGFIDRDSRLLLVAQQELVHIDLSKMHLSVGLPGLLLRLLLALHDTTKCAFHISMAFMLIHESKYLLTGVPFHRFAFALVLAVVV